MVRQKKDEIGKFSEKPMREAVQIVLNGMNICKTARIKEPKYTTLFQNV
jgi:hypothetical protein